MYPYYQTPYNVPRQPMTASLNGRIVTNIEEAKAAQIEFDGSQWYFPCPSEGRIYSKSINMQGLPVFNVYKLEVLQPSVPTLEERLSKLEMIVKEMKHNEPVSDDEPLTV